MNSASTPTDGITVRGIAKLLDVSVIHAEVAINKSGIVASGCIGGLPVFSPDSLQAIRDALSSPTPAE